MEIIKYKKLKNNIYEVELSNDLKIKLYDDVIIKYNLLINKKLTDKSLKEIIEYNESLDAYYLSIKYLNNKLRCEKEIYEYLKRKDIQESIISLTIERLKNTNYINRENYIKCYINDKIRLTNDGPLKIKRELKELGFEEEEYNHLLEYNYNDKIEKIINKKIESNHKLSNKMLKINITNYLINQGYSKEMFSTQINRIKIDNKDFIKKDTIKLIKKYSKKYHNKELLYYIKNKLYAKGYNDEEIGEVLNEELLQQIK